VSTTNARHRPLKTYSKDPTSTKWIGGAGYMMQKHQFQLLVREFGLEAAMEWAPQLVSWRDNRRPEKGHYLSWALEIDEGGANIPPEVERQFQRRLDNAVQNIALTTLRAGGKAAQKIAAVVEKIAAQIDDGEADDKPIENVLADEKALDRMIDRIAKLSGITQHLLQNQGFLARELLGGARNNPTLNVGGIQLNFGPPPRNRKLERKAKRVMEAEFTELPLGHGDAA